MDVCRCQLRKHAAIELGYKGAPVAYTRACPANASLSQLWQLVVLQGVLCGIANTFIFAPVFCYISEWWVARRGLAWGLIVSGKHPSFRMRSFVR